MWTYERFMSTLNRYVLNHAYLEGSMIEAYTTEEAVNCCTKYIWNGRAIGLPVPQHEGRISGMGCTGRKVCTDVQYKMVQQAHHSVLHQLVVMERYVDKDLKEICAAHDGDRTEAWINSRTYPMDNPMKRGLRAARPPKSPCGKGMTSMDTGST